MWGNLLYSFRFLCFKRVLRGYRQKLTTYLIYQQQRIHTTCSKTRKEDSIFYEGIPSQWCNILDVRQFVVRWAHRTTTNGREEDENASSLGKWDHVILVIPNGIPFTQTAFSGLFAGMVSEWHVPVTVDLHGRRLEIKKVYLAAILRDKGHFFYDALQLVFTRSCLIFREKEKYLFLWCLLGKNNRYHFNRQLKTSTAYVRKQWRSSLLQCSVHQLTGVLSDLFWQILTLNPYDISL